MVHIAGIFCYIQKNIYMFNHKCKRNKGKDALMSLEIGKFQKLAFLFTLLLMLQPYQPDHKKRAINSLLVFSYINQNFFIKKKRKTRELH